MKSSPVPPRGAATASRRRCGPMPDARRSTCSMRRHLRRGAGRRGEHVRALPDPLLQVVGTTVVPFLYEVEWPEGASVSGLRAEGRDRVRLLPGVADRLVVLGPLLRPLHRAPLGSRRGRLVQRSTRRHRPARSPVRRRAASFPLALVSGHSEIHAGSLLLLRRPDRRARSCRSSLRVGYGGRTTASRTWCSLIGAISPRVITSSPAPIWTGGSSHLDHNSTALADVAVEARWSRRSTIHCAGTQHLPTSPQVLRCGAPDPCSNSPAAPSTVSEARPGWQWGGARSSEHRRRSQRLGPTSCAPTAGVLGRCNRTRRRNIRTGLRPRYGNGLFDDAAAQA